MPPVPRQFKGVFRFPGGYAFLERDIIADYALLQSDDPFTGKFDDTAAQNTCATLQAAHEDGDPAILTGQIVTCDVDGRQTPVLFLFS